MSEEGPLQLRPIILKDSEFEREIARYVLLIEDIKELLGKINLDRRLK